MTPVLTRRLIHRAIASSVGQNSSKVSSSCTACCRNLILSRSLEIDLVSRFSHRFLSLGTILSGSLLGSVAVAQQAPGMNHPMPAMDHSMPGMHHPADPQGMKPGNSGMPANTHSMMHDLGPADSTYDLRFIDAMIQHHYGAVVMAKNTLGKGTGLGSLLNNIIFDQSSEIGALLKRRNQLYPNAPASPLKYVPGQSTELASLQPMTEADKRMMQMIDMHDLQKSDAGVSFAEAMIPHHEAAVAMARDALKKSRDPYIRWLSRQIIVNQTREINLLKSYINEF